MYATNTHYMLQKDCTGKAPVLPVYIVPVCKLVNAIKQNMSWAEHSSPMGWRQSMSAQAWRRAGCLSGWFGLLGGAIACGPHWWLWRMVDGV
jgi:hypothetical protein